MEPGDAIVVDTLSSVDAPGRKLAVYDREIGMKLLYEDPVSRAEHYLIRYPAGMKAKAHRHSVAQTIIVLEGRLLVNGRVIGPGSYCHFPPGEPMHHTSTDEEPCMFVTIFHGEADVEVLDGTPRSPSIDTKT
jgi:quercetin dioxygenase-like cupin family protein